MSNGGTTPSGELAAEIDIDADGTVEFSVAGAHSLSAQLQVDRPAGVTVRLTMFARVTFATQQGEFMWHTLNVAWRDAAGPTPVSFGPIDGFFPECGARLYGEDVPSSGLHRLTYTTRNATPGEQAWLLLGLQPLVPAPIVPGTNQQCNLEVLPLVSLPGTIDAAGGFAWTLSVVPPSAFGTQLFGQVATFEPVGGVLRTSNGSRGFFSN